MTLINLALAAWIQGNSHPVSREDILAGYIYNDQVSKLEETTNSMQNENTGHVVQKLIKILRQPKQNI